MKVSSPFSISMKLWITWVSFLLCYKQNALFFLPILSADCIVASGFPCSDLLFTGDTYLTGLIPLHFFVVDFSSLSRKLLSTPDSPFLIILCYGWCAASKFLPPASALLFLSFPFGFSCLSLSCVYNIAQFICIVNSFFEKSFVFLFKKYALDYWAEFG